MNLVFLGGEVPSHRNLLVDMGVRAIGINYWSLAKRGLPKTKDYLIGERFPEDVQIFVDGGGSQANASALSQRELEEYAANFQDWVAINFERITAVTEFDSKALGQRWIEDQRRTFGLELGEKFWPVWNTDMGYPALMALAEQYPNIAIPGESIDKDLALAGRARAIQAQFDVRFHGLGVAKPDNLRQVPLTTASTLSWASPMMRGETIVWDGSKLVRYQKKQKDQARPRYKAIIEKAGLDFEKVLSDDANEVTRLAIWSYLQLEDSIQRKSHLAVVVPLLSDNSDALDDPGSAETRGLPPDNSEVEVRKQNRPAPAQRAPEEMQTLPVLGVTSKSIIDQDAQGREFLRDAPILSSSSVSLRQCDSCFVSSNCPAFKPGSQCAFNLPVEIKTKEQLKALLNAIIEMQGARVAFARFAEELNGGYPDPNTGLEIDRLFKIVKQLKELEENREFIRITAERQASGGVLSALFGDRASQLRDLPNGGLTEIQATQIIHEQLED